MNIVHIAGSVMSVLIEKSVRGEIGMNIMQSVARGVTSARSMINARNVRNVSITRSVRIILVVRNVISVISVIG